MKIKVTFESENDRLQFEKFITRGFEITLINEIKAKMSRSTIYEYELISKDKGGRKKKLTEEEILKVRKLHQEGLSYQQLADQYGVARLTIINYCNCKK